MKTIMPKHARTTTSAHASGSRRHLSGSAHFGRMTTGAQLVMALYKKTRAAIIATAQCRWARFQQSSRYWRLSARRGLYNRRGGDGLGG